jgi:hypothetical protein
VWEDKTEPAPEQFSTSTKGTAFLITAGIQVIFAIGCFACGKSSMNADEALKQKEIDANRAEYQQLGQMEAGQIPQ